MPGAREPAVRVLFVNTRSAIGADVAVHLMLVRHLDPLRCSVYVATNARAVDAAQALRAVRERPGVGVIALNLGRGLSGLRGRGRIVGAAADVAAIGTALARLAAYVLRHRIDVIHTTDRPRDALVGYLLAAATRRKHVVHCHVKWYPEMGHATDRALRRAAGVVAISGFVRDSLIEGGVAADRVFVVHNAVDPGVYDPAVVPTGRLRAGLGIGPGAPLVAMAGRIMVWKGQRELVEAMARVRREEPETHLAVAGSEDALAGAGEPGYLAGIQERARALGIDAAVHWMGWTDDVASLFADADVVCVPSWEEPFGLVVVEAMAMRRAVVGFDSGALPEIIDHGEEGVLVPARDVDALAGAIVRLLRDPDLRAQMGARGRCRVLSQFTPERQATQMAAVYEQLCQR